MSENNKVFVLVGNSGSGKSEIGRKVFEDDSLIPSFTTREKRAGDRNDYIHTTVDRFIDLVESHVFLEYTNYNNSYYGTTLLDFDSKLAKNDISYAILTYNGARNLKRYVPLNVVTVLVDTPIEDRELMLSKRGELNKDRYKEDLDYKVSDFDYVINNKLNDISFAVNQLKSIVEYEIRVTLDYKYVAFDFDGTIVEDSFPNITKLRPYAKEVINKFSAMGGRVLIHTCRTGELEQDVIDFLEKEGIHYDTINANHPEMQAMYGNDPRKLGADLYIDDKGYKVNKIDWLEIADVLGVDIEKESKNKKVEICLRRQY